MRRTIYLLIVLLALGVCACSGDKSRTKVSKRVIDHEAYELGERHADEALQVSDDETALQEKLLDVKARISNIRENVGAQSAADYERGFTRHIQAQSDSLARILF